ncbi:MAG: FAD-dependent oxidoreductase [Ferruginibacter sp.]
MNTTIHTDVVVVGGGASGVAAAVAASAMGLKVILVERNLFLGGKATAAQVGTVCGLYEFSKNPRSTFIVNGFTKKFAEDLGKKSATTPLCNGAGLHYLPYDIKAFERICSLLLTTNNVKQYFNSILNTVEITNDQITSVSILSAGKKINIHLRSIVDCSGESIVSSMVGLCMIKSNNYQAAAQVFTMQDIGDVTEASLGMILKRELQSAIDQKQLDDYYDRVYIVPGSLKNDTLKLKIGIPVVVTHTPENLSELKASANLFVKKLTRHLVEHVPVFKNASLRSIAPEVGIRVGVRSTGKYILTEADVLTCKKSGDGIANGAWPIEEWEQNKRVKMRYFRLDDFYQVPVGCLQSPAINNLSMAGRNIAATDSAIASARVIGICLQTGYAAGLLAAGKLLNISEQETIKMIQSGQL